MNNKDFFSLGKDYLESNACGLWDGALKAETHNRLCELFVAKRLGLDVLSAASFLKVEDEYLVSMLRKSTLSLTDNLDEVIGFPLNSAPNYKRLVPMFVGKFLQLATDWFDEQTGLMKDSKVCSILIRITRNNLSFSYPALESYGFEFVDGQGDRLLGKRFLTMRSLLGQEVTVTPNDCFGCSFTLDKGINHK